VAVDGRPAGFMLRAVFFSPVPELNGYLSLLRPIVRRFYHSAPATIRTRFTRLFSA
jgi:hypothetical protein